MIFTATIKKLEPENPNFWMIDDRDGEIVCEVFRPSDDETDFDMTMQGYRQISEGYYIDSSCRIPVSVSVEV